MVGLLSGAVIVVALLGASAFFSASEISIFSLERHRLSQLLEHPGSTVEELATELDRESYPFEQLLVYRLVAADR
jgi:CBS domain containing-hemolysin-like protein